MHVQPKMSKWPIQVDTSRNFGRDGTKFKTLPKRWKTYINFSIV